LARLSILVVMLAIFASPARADGSFETIELGLRYVADVSDTGFHDYWERGRGAELFAVTSYGLTDLHAGVRYLDNNRRAEGVPEFESVFVWAGASMAVELSRRVRVSGGVSLGATNWFFDADVEPIPGLQDELEMGSELFARTRVDIGKHWHVGTSFRYQVSFTDDRITLGFVTLGVSRSLEVSWLKKVME
jgi:hypothetical protein